MKLTILVGWKSRPFALKVSQKTITGSGVEWSESKSKAQRIPNLDTVQKWIDQFYTDFLYP